METAKRDLLIGLHGQDDLEAVLGRHSHWKRSKAGNPAGIASAIPNVPQAPVPLRVSRDKQPKRKQRLGR